MVLVGIGTEGMAQDENLNAELYLEEVIGDRQFRERQEQEPIFQNIYKESLAKQEGEIVNSELGDTVPRFEVREGILYWVE